MKRTEYDGDLERSVLTSLIVNDDVLSRVRSRIKEEEPFRSRWSNLVYGWCVEFSSKYGKAPRKAVVGFFREFARKSRDKETVELLSQFLSGLDREHRQSARTVNQDYLFDQAVRYFSEVKLGGLKEAIEADLLRGEVERAVQRVSKFSPLGQDPNSFVDFFSDASACCRAISESNEDDVLVRFGGALGEFFGNQLSRDSLVAFLAPEKRGKTFWLLEVAWRASVRCKRRTVFYSVGDMSEKQVLRRLIARAAGRPLKAGEYVRPFSVRGGGDMRKLRQRVEMFKKDITAREVHRALKMIRVKTAHASLLKLKCAPNSTVRVADVRADLKELIRSGWVPDVIVIDYADILASESNERDFRHRTDETWRALRRLSQEFHCLVMTATQANAASYEVQTIGRRHFSEDKRKLAHVTALYGLNQTEDEKEQAVFRLNPIVVRDAPYVERRCVQVAGAVEVCNPAMLSMWPGRDNKGK